MRELGQELLECGGPPQADFSGGRKDDEKARLVGRGVESLHEGRHPKIVEANDSRFGWGTGGHEQRQEYDSSKAHCTTTIDFSS